MIVGIGSVWQFVGGDGGGEWNPGRHAPSRGANVARVAESGWVATGRSEIFIRA